jgi:hypothetical protein
MTQSTGASPCSFRNLLRYQATAGSDLTFAANANERRAIGPTAQGLRGRGKLRGAA